MLTNSAQLLVGEQGFPHSRKLSLLGRAPSTCSLIFVIRVEEIHISASFTSEAAVGNVSVQFLDLLFVADTFFVAVSTFSHHSWES